MKQSVSEIALKKKYSSKSLKFNFLCLLGWTFQLITHKSLTLTAPIHRHRCLGRGQRKQRRLTNKQWVKKIYKREEAFFPYSSWAEATVAFNQLVFPAPSAWAASVVQPSDQRWERSSPPSCCRPWTTGQSLVSRFHYAVAFTVLAPSLIKIQRVSAYVHIRVGLCLFLCACVCVCV